MEIKNIFFDFNGTILDDLILCYEIEDEMLVEYGLERKSLEFYKDNFGFPVIDYYVKIGYDFSKVSFDDVAKEFFEMYLAREKEETHLYPKVKETLAKLKNVGYKLYILSASESNLLHRQLQYLGIDEFFDGVCGDDDIQAKGKIVYGNKYLDKHQIDRSKTVMIGDTKHDYEVASALGLHPIMFTSGHNSKKVLEPLGTEMIETYDEILPLLERLGNK